MSSVYPIRYLGELVEVKGGKRLPKGAPYSDIPTKHPYIRVCNFVSGSIDETDLKFLSLEIHSKISRYTISSEDIYISIAGTIGLAGIIPEHLSGANLTENAAKLVIRNRKDLDKNYLSWYLNTTGRSFIDQKTKATSQPKLALFRIEEIPIPLPPIAEQKRIAAILDKAEELRGLRRKALEELDAIVQSIFLEMFGNPVTNPKNWERKSIKQIGQVITGNTPPRAQPELYGSAIEWIKSDNINTPHNYLTKASEGLSEVGKAVARTVPASSILVTCIAGTPDCIGNAAIADREVAFNQQINALVPEIGDFRFLYTQILVNKRLIQEASTSSMKGMVSKSRFEEIQFIFPPIEMQQDFGESFEKTEQLKATHRESLVQLDALFASLQHRAFRGEL